MKLSSWDISHQKIEILEGKRIETFQVSKHRSDLGRLLVEARGRDRVPSVLKCIGISTIPWTGDRVSP
jgi:hypothetical protein